MDRLLNVAGFALSGDFYPRGHLGDYSLVVPMRSLSASATPGFTQTVLA